MTYHGVQPTPAGPSATPLPWTLTTSVTVRVHPPSSGRIVAEVSARTVQDPPGSVVPVARSAETVKPALLSSMAAATDVWDASAFYAGATSVSPLPPSGWIFPTPVEASAFGVRGGTSRWQRLTSGGKPAPRVEIQLATPAPVNGWVSAPVAPSATPNPNDDSVGGWWSVDEMPASWTYRVVVTEEAATADRRSRGAGRPIWRRRPARSRSRPRRGPPRSGR